MYLLLGVLEYIKVLHISLVNLYSHVKKKYTCQI